MLQCRPPRSSGHSLPPWNQVLSHGKWPASSGRFPRRCVCMHTYIAPLSPSSRMHVDRSFMETSSETTGTS